MPTPLSQARITTFLPVIDMNRARSFYEGKLGFGTPDAPKPDGTLTYHVQDAMVALRPMEGGTKADYTALSFEVNDIEERVSSLEKAGVRFEDYDLPDFKTVNHIATTPIGRSAWFKDPDGNTIAIFQPA